MSSKKSAMRDVRSDFLRARTAQEAELALTRRYALTIFLGGFFLFAAGATELGNLFFYWRRLSEDRFGDLSTVGFLITLALSAFSWVMLAFAIHEGLTWMQRQDKNPPFISATLFLIGLTLSIAFPIYQVGFDQGGLLLRCVFSLGSTIMAGLALKMVLDGFALKDRHEAAAHAILALDDGISEFTRESNREGSRSRRMDNFEAELKESFALAFVEEHDGALDALTLAVDNEGLPMVPVKARMRNLIAGHEVDPQVVELIEMTAGTTAIGLQRRLSGRAMSTAEIAAVRRFLTVAPRPTHSDVLHALNA